MSIEKPEEKEVQEVQEEQKGNFYDRDERDPIFPENIVRERTINDAWHGIMWNCVRNGYRYKIEKGSYEGQERLQLPNAMVIIEEPWTRPLAVFAEKFSPPTSEVRIQDYFLEYLMSDIKPDTNQDYTYGQYITKQWDSAVNMLAKSRGNTNQCCIAIGNEESIELNDPPCLRNISFNVLPKKGQLPKLQMSVFFRSWDLVTGFPENLGGLQLLKEKMIIDLAHNGFEVQDGPIIASSSGAHLYEHYFGLLNEVYLADKIAESKQED